MKLILFSKSDYNFSSKLAQISDLESLIEWINTNTMSIEEQAIEKGIEDLLFD